MGDSIHRIRNSLLLCVFLLIYGYTLGLPLKDTSAPQRISTTGGIIQETTVKFQSEPL